MIGRLARCTALTVLNVVAAAAIALCVAGCGSSGGGSSTPPPPAGTIKLTSPALRADGRIPASFTCDGFGTQLPLRWSGVPRSARELALVMEDPDAPGGPYIHWVAYGIGPTARSVPASAREGRNSAGKTGWTPPCPPAAGKPHRYVFTLLALRRPSGLAAGASAAQVVGAARGRTLASGDLVARYGGR